MYLAPHENFAGNPDGADLSALILGLVVIMSREYSDHRHVMMGRIVYDLAADAWHDSPALIVKSPLGIDIAIFPLSFVRGCGDNSWAYVINVLHQLVQKPSTQQWVLMDNCGQEFDMEEPPCAGTFTWGLNLTEHVPEGE